MHIGFALRDSSPGGKQSWSAFLKAESICQSATDQHLGSRTLVASALEGRTISHRLALAHHHFCQEIFFSLALFMVLCRGYVVQISAFGVTPLATTVTAYLPLARHLLYNLDAKRTSEARQISFELMQRTRALVNRSLHCASVICENPATANAPPYPGPPVAWLSTSICAQCTNAALQQVPGYLLEG